MTITSTVKTIEIAEIEPTKPNRPLSVTHVRDLEQSFGTTAFATAIVVRPITDDSEYKWCVVAGFHRIEAAKHAGKKDVHAIIIEEASDFQLELIEIDENLLHRALTPAQEARAMARRKFLYQQAEPTARRGGDRKSKNRVASLKSFARATAAATGRSATAVNRAVNRGDKISPEALKLVQGTALETGQFLDQLTKLPPDEQKALIASELTGAKAGTDTNQGGVEKDLKRLRQCWAQACAEARQKFLNEITHSVTKKTAAQP